MKIKHQTFGLILTIFQFAHSQNENIQYLHYYQRRTIGMLNQVYHQTSFFFLLKVEVKYEALTMPQDQYRVETWLEAAMEQNNEVLILCVCVCVYSAALQLLPLPSDRSIWSMNCVAVHLHCPIFSPDIAASRKKHSGERWMLRVLVLCGLGLNEEIKVARGLAQSPYPHQVYPQWDAEQGVSTRPH